MVRTGSAQIRVFNTLTGRKEPLNPIEPGRLGFYVCGPTVYSFVHFGNARTFTSLDAIVRYLRWRGWKVTYVRNFTDIDDKIIHAAQQTGESARALAARFIDEFEKDAAALGLLEPDFAPRVSDHLPEIIRLIETLIGNGVAYESKGDVYFSVSRYPAYAKLSKRNLEEMCTGARVALGEQKREPLDFVLWKAAKPGEPAWESPWGPGRPGWHIECSAMAAKFLGESFDMHGGGLDLIFPHHENEIAQSEAAFHKNFARYWLHCGLLDLEGAKMSKSVGNIVSLRAALAHVDPEALRFFFLSNHYRNQLEFSEKSLADAETRIEYFYETLFRLEERVGGKQFGAGPLHLDPQKYLRDFEACMDDDFNFAGATSVLAAVFGEINTLLDKPPVKDKALIGRTLIAFLEQVKEMSQATGLLSDSPGAWLARRRDRAVRMRGIDVARVERLIAQRSQARLARNFEESDRIRAELRTLGIELMDNPSATRWRVSG